LGSGADAKLYVVSANKLYELDTSYSATERGTLSTSSGPIQMTDNGTEILICESVYQGATNKTYLYDMGTTTFTDLTAGGQDLNGISLQAIEYLDSLFIGIDADSGQYRWSGLLDGTSWPALQVATAESSPDNLVAMKVFNKNLWMAGEDSMEVMRSTGDLELAFKRIKGAVSPWGAVGPNAMTVSNQRLFWMGKSGKANPAVIEGRGLKGVPVSTPAIERALKGYAVTSDVLSYSYREGQDFAIWTFPGADKTWVYDPSMGQSGWHERGYWDTGGAVYERVRDNCYAHFNGLNIVGDHTTNQLFKLDRDTYEDDGRLVRRLRVTPPWGIKNHLVQINFLDLLFEYGVGDLGGAGDPVAMLRFSKDGGHNWSTQRSEAIGAIGVYNTPSVRFRMLGAARQWQFELLITYPIKSVLMMGLADIDILDE
jgi:hypothetical protein